MLNYLPEIAHFGRCFPFPHWSGFIQVLPVRVTLTHSAGSDLLLESHSDGIAQLIFSSLFQKQATNAICSWLLQAAEKPCFSLKTGKRVKSCSQEGPEIGPLSLLRFKRQVYVYVLLLLMVLCHCKLWDFCLRSQGKWNFFCPSSKCGLLPHAAPTPLLICVAVSASNWLTDSTRNTSTTIQTMDFSIKNITECV